MNIFIIWNTYSILELMLSVEEYHDFYLFIDAEYNKKDDYYIFNLCNRLIDSGFFKGVIDANDISKHSYQTVACMAYMNDYLFNLLNSISFENLIFLEEGLYNYIETDIEQKYLYLYNQATLFVNDIKNVCNKEIYGKIIEIYQEQQIINQYLQALNFDDFHSGSIDIIFFTSPINVDFNYSDYQRKVIIFLEQNYKDKNILIKRHPRDFLIYDSPLYNSHYVNFEAPGQIISNYYDCSKIYAYPSTVILFEKYIDKIQILKFHGIDNERYLNSFEHKKMKECKIVDIQKD